LLELLIELAALGMSWRFWVPTICGFVALAVLYSVLGGWLSASFAVAGVLTGLFWASARRA
jgi:hypothetical protein